MKTLPFLLGIFAVVLFLPACDRNDNQPEIADQIFYLDENSEIGTLVGKVEANDLDEQQTLSFEIVEGNTDNAFTLEKNTGILIVNNASVLDFEKNHRIDFQVLVSDNHPSEPLGSTAIISVVLNNLNEYAPEIEEQTFLVNERILTGTIIGNIVATDPDSGQTLAFKIESGNENQVIQLDTLSGELTVKDSAWFNYSVNQELVCMVSVCDNDSKQPLKSYAMVTIEVIDVPSYTIDFSGYVQKGPFIIGSSITISELDNTLQPTGRVFSTQVANNTGKYELPSVELESQYILLKSDGFYFNERTGELSEAQLTLHNLVDITDLESFNINVISHLEKDRIVELMKGGMDFTDAKQQAKNEILGIFDFVSVEQFQSDQMDIASSGEDNALLLAVSLILQGDRTTGDFSEILSQISLDLKEDGNVDNEYIGTQLINGINYANLQNIRQFIEERYDGLGIEYEIPDFEKYIDQFISQTRFVATNQFIFHEWGSFGLNILQHSITEVEHHHLNDVNYSIAVDVPEGRSLTVKIIGEGFYYAWGSEINMSIYREIEPIRYTSFTTAASGMCDVSTSFLYDHESPSNILTIEYYEDEKSTPSFVKQIEILNDFAPVDSTLLK